jgi:hypothetical protein
MKPILSFIFVISTYITLAQSPLIKQWDHTYGGNNNDGITSIQQTTDGGYILGGYTISDSSGEVSYNGFGDTDFWVVKSDSNGNKLWDKRYGGTGVEVINSLQQTSDGGYILGGVTYSDAGGDVTQATFDVGGNFGDIWLVKIDSIGQKIWDKRFGEYDEDWLICVRQTKDGGYIAAGYVRWGTYDDFWLIKIDQAGNQQWNKKYDGDAHANDWICSVLETADGGYIMAGTTYAGSNREYDYWVIKTNSIGEKVWDRKFGGNGVDGCGSFEATDDGEYILSGVTYSGLSGDLSEAPHGGINYWLVKINQAGVLQWEKRFGPCNEGLIKAIQTADHGYLVSGNSSGDMLFDKSESSFGHSHTWLVKTDATGNKLWDKTILTNSDDHQNSLIRGSGNSYLVAIITSADSGYYKSQNGRGNLDGWVIKFVGDTFTNIQEPNVRANCNIFPNPFTHDVSFVVESKNDINSSLTITNIYGQPVYVKQETNTGNTYTNTINLSYLPNGIYFWEATINGQRTIKQLIKQ